MRELLFNTIYLVIFLVLSPWIAWRFFVRGKNRRGWSQKLWGTPTAGRETTNSPSSDPNSIRIWLHAVSVGEVHLLESLVAEIRNQLPAATLFVSTTTETGFDRATALFGADHQVFFWPSDFSWAVNKALRHVRPDLVVLMELELWPNFLGICRRRDIPVAVANARLSAKSQRGYQRMGFLLRKSFRELRLVLAQNRTYADRFVELGCERSQVQVCGNIKYDALVDVLESTQEAGEARAAEFGLGTGHKLFVAGSTQIEDERAAATAFARASQAHSELRMVVIPRHPDRRNEVLQVLAENNLQGVLCSQLKSGIGGEIFDATDADNVLVVDTIGELIAWWSQASVAFVGGSMGSRGGQNMIEPSAFGVPVCFGPNTWNFRAEVEALLAEEAACVVNNASELEAFLTNSTTQAGIAREMGQRAQRVVQQNQGATKRTVEQLVELVQQR